MLSKHQKIISSINPNYLIVERMLGGMSNYTYLIKDQNNEKFIFRIPGEGGDNFVDYHVEEKNLKIISPLNINTKTILLLPNLGMKISKYVEGKMLDENSSLTEISRVLKSLHNSKLTLSNDYDPLYRLFKYEKLHTNNDSLEYLLLKKMFIEIFEEHLEKHMIYPCHNDAQIANFIESDKNKIYLLDWEFSGTNDFIYDIASFGNRDFDFALRLIEIYIDKPSDNDYIRLYGWRMFQCLQWFNVASFKHQNRLSEKLHIDFEKIANNYLITARYMYNNIKNFL